MSEVQRMLMESREKLLDLTLRNPLINYNLKKKNRLIIVDELPNLIYDKILNGIDMELDYIPYDKNHDTNSTPLSAKEYAKKIGIYTSEETSHTDIKENHKDNKIQTLHYPDDLEKIIKKKKADSNMFIQEKGTNILYLSIGFLEWKQSKNLEKTITSPLILIPIKINKTNKIDKNTAIPVYTLSYTSDVLFSNLSLILKIERELGIKLPEFTEDIVPEEYFDKINNICNNNKELIRVNKSMSLDFFQFNKLLMFLDLDSSKWPDNKNIEDNLILSEIAGDQVNINTPKGSYINKSEEIGLVMDADSSQMDAIQRVMNGENLIIEGPPGTGKSQTIANLIAVALGNNKTVLFVAEKLVALEVVKKRLDSVGLGDFILELHSNKSNKLNFYSSIKKRLSLNISGDSEELDDSIEEIKNIKKNMQEYLNLLHNNIDFIEKTPYNIFGEVQNREKEIYKDLERDSNLLKLDKINIKEIEKNLDVLESFILEKPEILDSPWNGFEAINSLSFSDSETIINVFEDYDSEINKLISLFDEDILLSKIPKTKKILDILNILNKERLFSNAPSPEDLNKFKSFEIDNLKKIMTSSETYIQRSKIFNDIDIDVIESISELKNLSRTLRGLKGIGFFGKLFNKEYKESRKKFNIICINLNNQDPEEMSNILIQYINRLDDFIQDIKNYYKDGGEELINILGFKIIDFNKLSNLKYIKNQLEEVIKHKYVYEWLNKINSSKLNNNLIDPFYTDNQDIYIDAIRRLLLKSEPILISIDRIEKKIQTYGRINKDIFFKGSLDFNLIHDNLSKKIDSSDELKIWIDVSIILVLFNNYKMNSVLEYAKKNKLEKEIKNLFLYAYYREWSYKIFKDNSILSRFSRFKHDQNIKDFRILDYKLGSLYSKEHSLKLSKNLIYDGINGIVSEKTEMKLIQNEINKQKRHLPIRELLKRSPKSVRALKPCFMMSPLSVSQFIDTNQEQFDLMIIDEASQILPEDSIGAIARSKQVVIVGDSKQLPPSDFFKTSIITNDEETILDSSPSILDLMSKVYPNVERLKWHYRSQHESLISFSNYHFYDNELMIFPSPNTNDFEFGIKRKYIKNGHFVNQINKEEANEIVEAVYNYFIFENKDSLGVVTINKKQSEYINRLIDEKRKDDSTFDILIEKAIINNLFFIKNLENIQGDEADILYIGITYGPDEKGDVYQRFGVLNRVDSGWKRLNVLITRAKKKIVIFTSLRSDQIITKEDNKSIMSFKNYLKYIESGYVQNIDGISTNKEPDSPFEESVIKYIQSLGFIAEPQVGVSGFFIDIGIKGEGSSNYILGIECDGATYHSSKSARDRDRLRQSILEKMGWNIYRIWSTDWFKNRKSEEARLKKVLIDVKNNSILDTHIENSPDSTIEIVEEPFNLDMDNDILEKKNNTTIDVVDNSLLNKLLEFREKNISSKYNIDSKSILSDNILEHLITSKPTTLVEFRKCTPEYLRANIDKNQMEFISEIFNILEEYK